MRTVITLLALLVSFHAQAFGPCDADADKLCGAAHQGETVKVCLHKNVDKVSADCKTYIKSQEKTFQDREKSLEGVRKNCKDDIAKLCAEEKDSDKPLTVCLMSEGEKLKDGCKAEVNRHIREYLPGIREIGAKD